MPVFTKIGPYAKGRGGMDDDYTEEIGAEPDLDYLKQCVRGEQSNAAWFMERNRLAFNSWHSRWNGQTVDGRKHPYDGMAADDVIWPWEGACDTRVRTCDKIVRDHMTVANFAWMNAKVQAKSTRPMVTLRESQQATTLLNWQLYTKMQPELNREIALALNWRFALGSSAIEVCWDQERRIDKVEVTAIQLADYIAEQNQEPPDYMHFADVLQNSANDDQLMTFIQSLSPIVSRPDARGILKDLRELRYATLPIPYVYKSQPRWTALRLMIDLIIPLHTDSLQRARWVDRIEWVTETELTDRIETEGYDPHFVDQAIAKKGRRSSGIYTRADQPMGDGFRYVSGQRTEDFDERIELHRFWQKGHQDGVPALYVTTFHMDVDIEAKCEQSEYLHGEMPFHELRNEYHERPILTSRGIPEIAYTWEMELKAQRDGQTDRSDLQLRPPLLAPYQDVNRIKAQFEPGVIFPERREGSMRFMPITSQDDGSVKISAAIKLDIEEFMGLFGMELDPILKQQRQMELADAVLEEFKPPMRQTFQLDQQLLADAEVVAVVGELQRPGLLSQVSRSDIQGGHEITATVDLRELDKDWLKEKGVLVNGVLQMDTEGVVDRTSIIRNLMSAIDYNLADMAIKNPEAATQAERDDEINKISQIIGSGLDLPLPQSGNFQLRLQTLQQTLQDALQNNPATRKIIQANPDVMKVIQNRAEYYQNQLQQQQNAQIGRSLSTRTFTKQAPMLADSGGGVPASGGAPAAGAGGGGY